MKTILIICTCIFICNPADAHAPDDTAATEEKPPGAISLLQNSRMPLYEIALWGGYAFDSLTLWGKTTDATLSTFGVRFNRKFLRIYGTIIEYSAELNLYARYSYPAYTELRNRTSLSGFGISPVGLQTNFFAGKTVQPFLNTSAGFMFLEKPFPDSRGKKKNFTFSLGAGLELEITQNASLTAGYRYLHLSNGETGEVNPGIDSSMLYTSVTFNL